MKLRSRRPNGDDLPADLMARIANSKPAAGMEAFMPREETQAREHHPAGKRGRRA